MKTLNEVFEELNRILAAHSWATRPCEISAKPISSFKPKIPEIPKPPKPPKSEREKVLDYIEREKAKTGPSQIYLKPKPKI